MRVLFVCVGNSCRSQMAEALARHHGLRAESAGTTPAETVHPLALQVLAEKGITHRGRPKGLPAVLDHDLTVTMGCGVQEACPSLLTDEDWGLDDPVGQGIEAFRATRDAIEERILALVATKG